MTLLLAALFGSIAALAAGVSLRAIAENPYRSQHQRYAQVPVPSWIAAYLADTFDIEIVTRRV